MLRLWRLLRRLRLVLRQLRLLLQLLRWLRLIIHSCNCAYKPWHKPTTTANSGRGTIKT
jgi:hypothetical protein